MKKVGKTTRPFRYDLNQIPYDYTVEVANRFKGLDLMKFLMNYGQRFVTLYKRQSTHGPHQVVNTEIRLIIFFAAKDGEAIYSQRKQGQELTVAQIMSS